MSEPLVNPPMPVPTIPAINNDDWDRRRAEGRYIPGVGAATVVCLDCGCVVHIALQDRHDLTHDGG